MVIDLLGVKENSFLGEGKHFVKIVKVEKTEWNNVIKITFADKDGFIFQELFSLEKEKAWKLKQLAKAVNALDENELLDTNNLIGKYLHITIDKYVSKKNGKEYLTIKKFEASKLNKTKPNTTVKAKPKTELPPSIEDIDEDAIPF